MLPLSWPPQPIAFAIWLLVEAAAFALVLWAGLRLSGAMRATAIGACIACQVVRFSVRDWDYRAAVYLASFVFLAPALAAVRKILAIPDTAPLPA